MTIYKRDTIIYVGAKIPSWFIRYLEKKYIVLPIGMMPINSLTNKPGRTLDGMSS